VNIIDSKIDLAVSFEKFKKTIRHIEVNYLQGAKAYEELFCVANEHIRECTLPDNVESADPNDLKDINI